MCRFALILVAAQLLCTSAFAQNVAIVSAVDTPSHTNDVRVSLFTSQEFPVVDVLDARTTSPTLADLQSYFAVLVMAEPGVEFLDGEALGHTLADFADTGGGVVVAGPALDVATGTAVGGRLIDGGYLPLDLSGGGGIEADPSMVFERLEVAAWAVYGMNDFDGGSNLHISGLRPIPGGENLAEWVRVDGTREPLVTVIEPHATAPMPAGWWL